MQNERRLIDAYKLEDLVRSNSARYHHADDVIAAIAGQPTVDALETVLSRVGDTIFEVDPEHGVVKHKIYEVCVVYKTTATDGNGKEWDDFYTSDDIATAYKTRQEAEADFCSYGERREGE